jgi:CBS domain containing-hemolysin-like protein
MLLPLTLAAIVVLVATSAFFSSSEIAIFSLEDHRLSSLETEPGGKTLAALREDPHRLLVTILVGNNFVNTAIAALTTALLVDRLSGGVAVLVATLVASSVVLVFGEIVPKSYGVANPEGIALRVAGPVKLVERLLYPVVVAFEVVTGAITRVVGGGRDIERPYLTREEIVALVDTAEELGVIGDDEQAMIQRVFRFNTTSVGSVAVPRSDVVAVDAEAGVPGAIETCGRERLTRLPVYEDEFDNLVGYVDLRDLVDAPEDADLTSLAHPLLHVFEGREIDEVLAELQAARAEVAVVYDEFGAVEGLVTTEDLVEQIVGEIFDVGEEPTVVRLSPTAATARGTAATRAVNEAIGTALPTGGETVAGLLAERLSRAPEPGDEVQVGDATLTVEAVEENRPRRVRIERRDSQEGTDDQPADGPE